MCIEKSLLLFRFAPCGATCQDSDSSKAAEASSAPLLRSSSISEGDFQASPATPATGPDEDSEAKGTGTGTGQTPLSGAQVQNAPAENSRKGQSGSTENVPSQTGEPASPSTFPRKAPFNRGRLRLLSFRSIEEPRMAPSIKERYPVLKHILYFIRDQALTTAR